VFPQEARVIRKVLEAFFQHKLLLLLPPVLIPAIVTPVAIISNPPTFETAAGVWIDRPAYLTEKDGGNTWISAVQTQSTRLNELLKTRAFQVDVAQRTSLAPLTSSAAGQVRLADLLARSVVITGGTANAAGNEHLLVIRVSAANAQLAYELCKAVVDAYQEKTAADQADQGSVAVDFYQGRLTEAQKQLTKASTDLRRYVAARQSDGSDVPTTNDNSLTAAMLDPRLAGLQGNVQAAQLDVNNAQATLKQAQLDAMMSAQGLQYGFQVLDAPQLPAAATPQIKKIIVYPIAAAVAGLGFAAMLLVIFVASDRSVRSDSDLAPELRILGTVPHLKLKNVPKQLRSVATRRAIGAPVGMALPAQAK
jgi:hypothetical protein